MRGPPLVPVVRPRPGGSERGRRAATAGPARPMRGNGRNGTKIALSPSLPPDRPRRSRRSCRSCGPPGLRWRPPPAAGMISLTGLRRWSGAPPISSRGGPAQGGQGGSCRMHARPGGAGDGSGAGQGGGPTPRSTPSAIEADEDRRRRADRAVGGPLIRKFRLAPPLSLGDDVGTGRGRRHSPRPADRWRFSSGSTP
jgi:hypothetical protein